MAIAVYSLVFGPCLKSTKYNREGKGFNLNLNQVLKSDLVKSVSVKCNQFLRVFWLHFQEIKEQLITEDL